MTRPSPFFATRPSPFLFATLFLFVQTKMIDDASAIIVQAVAFAAAEILYCTRRSLLFPLVLVGSQKCVFGAQFTKFIAVLVQLRDVRDRRAAHEIDVSRTSSYPSYDYIIVLSIFYCRVFLCFVLGWRLLPRVVVPTRRYWSNVRL